MSTHFQLTTPKPDWCQTSASFFVRWHLESKDFWKQVFHRENGCTEMEGLEFKGRATGSQNGVPCSVRLLGLLLCEPVQGFPWLFFGPTPLKREGLHGYSCWRREEGYAAASTFDTLFWDRNGRPFNSPSCLLCLLNSTIERVTRRKRLQLWSYFPTKSQCIDMFQRPNPGYSSEFRARWMMVVAFLKFQIVAKCSRRQNAFAIGRKELAYSYIVFLVILLGGILFVL